MAPISALAATTKTLPSGGSIHGWGVRNRRRSKVRVWKYADQYVWSPHESIRREARPSTRMNLKHILPVLLVSPAMLLLQPRAMVVADPAATRATLSNGMRVVIVRDSLAPLATVQMNFLVGGNESPAGFPGMAHAQEHMAFRGCTGMTADQTAAIYAQLGDESNAETEQDVTDYYATVPATDLDVALQAQAMCLHGIQNSQADWEQERGAIEQEVAGDLSDPTYAFLNRVNADMFAGTP